MGEIHCTSYMPDIFRSVLSHSQTFLNVFHQTPQSSAVTSGPWLLAVVFVCVVFASHPSCVNNFAVKCSTHREQTLFATISRVCITHWATVLGGLRCVLFPVVGLKPCCSHLWDSPVGGSTHAPFNHSCICCIQVFSAFVADVRKSPY